MPDEARPRARTVLVTDGEQRAALALVRSLASAGHAVHVCSTSGRSLAGASRAARSETRVADPLARPDDFVRDVEALVARLGADVLLPIAEPALLALLPRRDRLPGVVLPFVEPEAFRAVCDKQRVAEVAATLGIAVPRQVVAATAADALAANVAFPVVLKPARSVGEVDGRREKLAVTFAADRAELARRLDDYGAGAFPLLLQERIDGPGTGIFLLLWDGAPRAAFAHRRLLEKPPWGGVSVYREAIAAPPDLLARSVALLDAFGWRGVAMVEYKVRAETGVPYLMEINGRFWGSLQLALDAGVDFPRLLLECADGRAPAAPAPYRAGVRSRWFWGTVDHLVSRLRGGRGGRGAAAPPPVRRVVADLLRVWRPGDREEVWRWRDPRPFWRETTRWLARR